MAIELMDLALTDGCSAGGIGCELIKNMGKLFTGLFRLMTE